MSQTRSSATSSAPGKIYLSGEHAVVHGEPAVLCAIDRRATVTVEPRSDAEVSVTASALSLSEFTVEYNQQNPDQKPRVDAPPSLVTTAIQYIDAAVEQARDAIGDESAGFDITVDSEIPLGAGLGSSAAVVVAGIDAATQAHGVELDDDELADRAYQAESAVQDGEASRADTFCSTTGGAVQIQARDCHSLTLPAEMPAVVVGYNGDAGDTETLVAGVRERMKHGSVMETIRTIGSTTQEVLGWFAAVEAEPDEPTDELFNELGHSLNVNHGLLSAIGVSSRSLDSMIWTARDAGARGAKLTGAGGGGCVVALPAADNATDIEHALELNPACEQAFTVDIATTGVKRNEK